MKSKLSSTLGVMLALAAAAACSSSDSAKTGDDQNVVEGNSCRIFSVQHQKFIVKGGKGPLDLDAFVAKHKSDPVLQNILLNSCPGNYREVMDKLNGAAPKIAGVEHPELKKTACANDTTVRVISERATQLKRPDDSRALVSRTCDSQQLFFLLDPVEAQELAKECTDKTSAKCHDILPDNVEIIGEDKATGVFTYYAREGVDERTEAVGNVWKFYGTSEDYVTNGYDCDGDKFNGACQPLIARDPSAGGLKDGATESGTRCASCHPGGGLVEKELNSPWITWAKPPGARELVSTFGEYIGTQLNDGDDFESTVGNSGLNKTVWTPTRVKLLKAKSVADKSAVELLRPLFCTIDINLQTSSDPRGQLSSVRQDLFVDPSLSGGFGSVAVDAAKYAQLLASNKQTIGEPGDKDFESLRDSSNAFVYPERSKLDQDYVALLIQQNIISEEFAKDILAVDFTRAIFSPVRCGLLAAAEGITDLTPAGIQSGVVAAVIAGGKAAALPGATELAGYLSAVDKDAHTAAVTAFMAACNTENGKGTFLAEALEYASYLRRSSRLLRVQLKIEKGDDNAEGDFGIIDFAETVPVDDFERTALMAGKKAARPFFTKDCILQRGR